MQFNINKNAIELITLLLVTIPYAGYGQDLDQDLITAAAQEKGGLKKIQRLVKKGANINAVDKEGTTALMVAALAGNKKTVAFLIENKANVNMADNTGKTALMYAAQEGRSWIVKSLIEANATIDAIDKQGQTALLIVINQVIKPVLEAQNAVNELAKIMEATYKQNYKKTLEYLIRQHPLVMAINKDSLGEVKKLTEIYQKQSIELSQPIGFGLIISYGLQFAASSKQPNALAIVKYLIEKGAPLNPFVLLAAYKRNNKVVLDYLKGKADVLTKFSFNTAKTAHDLRIKLLREKGITKEYREKLPSIKGKDTFEITNNTKKSLWISVYNAKQSYKNMAELKAGTTEVLQVNTKYVTYLIVTPDPLYPKASVYAFVSGKKINIELTPVTIGFGFKLKPTKQEKGYITQDDFVHKTISSIGRLVKEGIVKKAKEALKKHDKKTSFSNAPGITTSIAMASSGESLEVAGRAVLQIIRLVIGIPITVVVAGLGIAVAGAAIAISVPVLLGISAFYIGVAIKEKVSGD